MENTDFKKRLKDLHIPDNYYDGLTEEEATLDIERNLLNDREYDDILCNKFRRTVISNLEGINPFLSEIIVKELTYKFLYDLCEPVQHVLSKEYYDTNIYYNHRTFSCFNELERYIESYIFYNLNYIKNLNFIDCMDVIDQIIDETSFNNIDNFVFSSMCYDDVDFLFVWCLRLGLIDNE